MRKMAKSDTASVEAAALSNVNNLESILVASTTTHLLQYKMPGKLSTSIFEE
jgi:hypothetical protein